MGITNEHWSLQTVRRFGGLDILVSNAAVNPAVGDTTTVSAEHYPNSIFQPPLSPNRWRRVHGTR